MTQKIIIFSNDGSNPISVVEYTAAFAANLTASSIKHKVLEIGAEEYYWGDYTTGRVVDKHELPLIDEIAIEGFQNLRGSRKP